VIRNEDGECGLFDVETLTIALGAPGSERIDRRLEQVAAEEERSYSIYTQPHFRRYLTHSFSVGQGFPDRCPKPLHM
jgi:hypothetical protein